MDPLALVKPKVVPKRPTPYHLTKRVQDLIDSIVAEGIIKTVGPNEEEP